MDISCVLASLSLRSPVRGLVHALAAALLCVLCGAETGSAQPLDASAPDSPRPVQATDLYRMHTVDHTRISPYGRSVAYTTRHIAPGPEGTDADARSYRWRLYVAPLARAQSPRLLVQSTRPLAAPAWHPDGTLLAYVQPVEGTPQVFVVPLDGGVPYQLTDMPHGARAPQWSPNGERVLVASSLPQAAVAARTERVPPRERPGRTPKDLVRTAGSDSLLVLRHVRTLEPLDTLALGPRSQIRPPNDSARSLRTPSGLRVPDSLAAPPVDSLTQLAPDSLRAVLDRLRLRPDTVVVPVPPDTAAAPGGTQVQMRRWLAQNRRRGTALVSTRPHLYGLYGKDGPRSTPRYRHYFTVPVPQGLRSHRPPRPAPHAVTQGFRSYGRADWLPGGGQLVVSGTPSSPQHPDRVRQRNLYVVDLTRDRVRRLLRIEGHALTAPRATSDGTTIAFRARALSDTTASGPHLGLFALDGRSQPRLLPRPFAHDLETVRWSPDGWYLYATARDRGRRVLYRFTPFAQDTSARARPPALPADRPTSRDTFRLDSTMIAPAPAEQLTADARSVQAFDVTDATAVYAATGPRTPSALFANTVSFGNERVLAAPNAAWVETRRLARSSPNALQRGRLSQRGSRSRGPAAWVTRPVAPADSARAPLVVQVHGAPSHAPSGPLYAPRAWLQRQYLAGQGLAMLEIWPRAVGPSLAGSDSRRGARADLKLAQTVLALTDSVANRPWVDSSRVALATTAGGDAAAMPLLSVTDRYAAALLRTPLARSQDAPGGKHGPTAEGSDSLSSTHRQPSADSLAQSIVPFVRDSTSGSSSVHVRPRPPESYAPQIRTPLLLLQHGVEQPGPQSPGARLYTRLKHLERSVEFVQYPPVRRRSERTFPARLPPFSRLDRLVRTYEFLNRFLAPSPPTIRSSSR